MGRYQRSENQLFRIDLSSSVAYAYPLTRVWTWNLGDSHCAPLYCHEHNPIKLH